MAMDTKDQQLLSGMLIFVGLFVMIFSAPSFINFGTIGISITAIGFVILLIGLYLFLRTIT